MTTDGTLHERGKTHGHYPATARVAQELKRALKLHGPAGALSDVHTESLAMICTKIARIVCGDPLEADHWRDIAGYARLGELACSPVAAPVPVHREIAAAGIPVEDVHPGGVYKVPTDLVPPAGTSVAYAPRSADDQHPWTGTVNGVLLREPFRGTREGVIAQLESMLR